MTSWNVDLSVEVVPCPAERLIALRAAWVTIYRLAANETLASGEESERYLGSSAHAFEGRGLAAERTS